jgi:hypothetical protein
MNGPHGRFNQAGDLAPRTGEQSRAIRRNLSTLGVDSAPLFAVHGFDDFTAAGAVVAGIRQTAIVPTRGYNGDLPAGLLPVVQRRPPWESSGE